MTWSAAWHWVLDLGWLAVLLLLLKHFWRDRRALRDAQYWLKAKGHITSCELTQSGNRVWPKIEYTYQVYDKDLIGEYLFLDTAHNNPSSKYSRSVAYKAAVAFKEEKEIDIYYNPNRPEQSALDVTIPIKLNAIIALIGFFIVVHIGLMVWRLLG